MFVLGISGYKGSGKDTFGNIFVEKYNFKRLSFATKLKESAAALFGWDPEIWEDLKNEEGGFMAFDGDGNAIGGVGYREFLQRYGLEAHRDIFGEDFWVVQALKNLDPKTNYVVTDCRFDNELIAIRNLGGITIRIERDVANPTDVTHRSEILPDGALIDYFVPNNGTIQELETRADTIIKSLNIK